MQLDADGPALPTSDCPVPRVPDLFALGFAAVRHEPQLRLLVLVADELAAGADSLSVVSDNLMTRDEADRLHDLVRCSHGTVCALPRRPVGLTAAQGDDLDARLRRLLRCPPGHAGPHPHDDTRQKAHLRLLRCWARGDFAAAIDPFTALLGLAPTVVRGLLNESHRRRCRRKESGGAVPDVAAPEGLCPVEREESEAAALAIEDAVRSLDGPEGAAARMKWLDRRTQSEIAGAMGVSQGHVSRLLCRARRRLGIRA